MALMVTLLDRTAAGQTSSPYLVQARQKPCQHGLHAQPKGGPFSVFLFCDDALGSNIGVILTEPGAGPGKIELSGTKVWDKWDTNNRFWQETKWATDVVNFAWSPSFRYIYVATSGIYGDGGFFKLDLKERLSERLLPKSSAKYSFELGGGHLTKIEKVDLNKRVIIVGIYWLGQAPSLVANEEVHLE